ncbi:Fc.00g074690.m01.CDS01 [Cosmosporella sp. VM-42]
MDTPEFLAQALFWSIYITLGIKSALVELSNCVDELKSFFQPSADLCKRTEGSPVVADAVQQAFSGRHESRIRLLKDLRQMPQAVPQYERLQISQARLEPEDDFRARTQEELQTPFETGYTNEAPDMEKGFWKLQVDQCATNAVTDIDADLRELSNVHFTEVAHEISVLQKKFDKWKALLRWP